MAKIKELKAHKIVNSRGDWTVEAVLTLDNNIVCKQAVPAGVSKGENEAITIPAEKSVEIISTVLHDAFLGEDPTNQAYIDSTLIDMDGTPNKKHLGGNTTIAVSLVCAKAAAAVKQVPLFQYLKSLYLDEEDLEPFRPVLPTPVFNILNGGKHASNKLSFQEFMVIPSPEMSYDKQLDVGLHVYDTLKELLASKNSNLGVGDEGGFAPAGMTPEKALALIGEAISKNYILGKDAYLGMDVAAESFVSSDDEYSIKEMNLNLSSTDLVSFYKNLIKKYPLIYVEDPFYEKDYEGWELFYKEFSKRLLVVGDDLVVTNPSILQRVAKKNLINAVIVKPNQVGTLTETFDFIRTARNNKMSLCISHRSGDTAEDTFIADLAVAVDAEFIKSGAPARGERTAKYNRLLEIFSETK